MKTSAFMRRFAVVSMVSGLGAAAAGNAGSSVATDPRIDMVTALKAMGPHRSLGEPAKIFSDLVGTWDGEYTDFLKDGTVKHASGEFIVGWVLDGRAIQDIFTIHPSEAGKDRYIATTLRYFDPQHPEK